MSTVEELIANGEQLEKDRIESLNNSLLKNYGARLKSFNGVQFTEWTSQSIFFLEEQKPSSLVTEELRRKFESLRPETSYDFYESMLGALKAYKNQM